MCRGPLPHPPSAALGLGGAGVWLCFMVSTSFWLSLEQGSPLVFLSTHKSLLDGFLLPFVLFSQGLGVVRVALDPRTCSPALR